MYKVVLSQHRLLHYRRNFFELLERRCREVDIELHVLHGQASARESLKKDEGRLQWADRVENIIVPVGPIDVVWQPVPKHLRDADLFVMIQENRIISNYSLILRRRMLGGPTLAFWGHGANFQSAGQNLLRERWKKFLLRQVDYWFAYTEATVRIVSDAGFPPDRISCLDNSIDTSLFRQQCESVDGESINRARRELGIGDDGIIALFCGSIYPEKRIDLLISAGDILRRRFPNLHIVVLGDGPSMPDLLLEASTRPWLHALGTCRGEVKAMWYRAARVVLNPGALGLHILDAFVAGVPLVSTKDALHGPEIVYLVNGINGSLTDSTTQAYADAVADIIGNEEKSHRLAYAASEAGKRYSIENMANNFLKGIEDCRRAGKREF